MTYQREKHLLQSEPANVLYRTRVAEVSCKTAADSRKQQALPNQE